MKEFLQLSLDDAGAITGHHAWLYPGNRVEVKPLNESEVHQVLGRLTRQWGTGIYAGMSRLHNRAYLVIMTPQVSLALDKMRWLQVVR